MTRSEVSSHDGQRTFQTVEDEDENAEPLAHQSIDVRGTGISRAAGGDVDSARTCDENRTRERSDEICNRNEECDDQHDINTISIGSGFGNHLVPAVEDSGRAHR